MNRRKSFRLSPFFILLIVVSPPFKPAAGQEKVKDFDGNEYKTVTIGTQVWMAENLHTTHYSTGESIAEIKDDTLWANAVEGAWCMNNHEPKLSAIYGYLYNWYAVTPAKKLCPDGWHIPTANEWKKLETFLGGPGSAGGKLKEAGTSKWLEPNSDADNISHFSGLPGGSRNSDGSFNPVGETGHWWTSNEFAPTTAWHRQLYNNAGFIDNVYAVKNEGCSVRCLKD
jgi:uncharacterized protein (TIGR02145 family)